MRIVVTGLDDLTAEMDKIVKGYPREVNKFLRAEGQKAKKKAVESIKKQASGAKYTENYRKHSEKQLKNRTPGNLRRSVSVQRPYKYFVIEGGSGKDSVKAYAAKSKGKKGFHAHLVEHGHKAVFWGKRTERIVKGFYLFERARKETEPVFETDCMRFVEELIKML